MEAGTPPLNEEKKIILNPGTFQSSETLGEQMRREQEAGRDQQLMTFYLVSLISQVARVLVDLLCTRHLELGGPIRFHITWLWSHKIRTSRLLRNYVQYPHRTRKQAQREAMVCPRVKQQ